MPSELKDPAVDIDATHARLVQSVVDAVHRTMLHFGLWWREVEHQFGFKDSLEIEREVWAVWSKIMMKRLGAVLEFEQSNGVPKQVLEMVESELQDTLRALSTNWLASDGVWFRTVEEHHGLAAAQRCNDTAWMRFSPVEASQIKDLLQLPDHGGLDALEAALRFRLYSWINEYTILRPDNETLILQMNKCRVQDARTRQGLPEYPCKNAGIIEYTQFVTTIDDRIVTECIACPPDPHPAEFVCGWQFTLPSESS